MAVNVQALQVRDPGNRALRRYDEVAQLLTGSGKATANDGVKWVQELVQDLQVPGLSTYGLTEADFSLLIEKAQKASSMKGNPIALTAEELGEILGRSL
jgi:alcohol dehydrogenase class IV